jgi:hypothetical protein
LAGHAIRTETEKGVGSREEATSGSRLCESECRGKKKAKKEEEAKEEGSREQDGQGSCCSFYRTIIVYCYARDLLGWEL